MLMFRLYTKRRFSETTNLFSRISNSFFWSEKGAGIAMDTNQHFAKGSSQPSFPNDGQLRLFSMRFCPFAHRVHLVLNAKNIPYHVTYINLTEKPEWYASVNPNGKVPALQLVDEPQQPFLVESMIIAEYLDEKYPDVKLYPTDPLAKAETKLWIERVGPIAGTFYRLVYTVNSDDESDRLLAELNKELTEFETELAKRATPYFAGAKPGIFDYGIWPWFERFGILSSIVGEKYKFDEQFPKLAQWTHLLKEDEAVKKHLLSNFTHTKFSLGRRAGTPDYDLLVKDVEQD
ncbi:Pyrimidodiazepine synthase [Pseudolycoriella hygida]|uniref:Pyrimidodiazepine synthase n=1 Tax=Pseudolycoriella hygida TaxID=35572 RepID=A0A9Q0N0T3_9DIPT|nr:Pyrimidodiazepine synthase [Pseudolycoriella hygida]